MRLQNIHNEFAKVFLFIRNEDNSLSIKENNSFLPYFYEPTTGDAEAIGYDGTKLKKIYCRAPHEVPKQRTQQSYEADIIYTNRYVIDNVDNIEKSNTRIVFFDLEIQATELPRPKETKKAPYPISTIVIYDNYTSKYKTFFLDDYESEYAMLEDFCNVIKKLQPDILTGWNAKDFDWAYLFYKFPQIAEKISPISKKRIRDEIEYPAGIAIIDMLGLYYKYTLGKKDSYALDNVAHEELAFELWGDTDFMNIKESKEKCQKDVEKLVKLDEDLQLFEYYDEIRRLSKCAWEDLGAEFKNYQWQSNNSRVIDMLALQEAKKLNVVLPSRYNKVSEEKIEGAYREIFGTGLFKDLAKVDVSGCYPRMIIDFCLSPENYVEEKNDNTIQVDIHSRETHEKTNTYHVLQNSTAILPSLMKRLLNLKDELKAKMKTVAKDSDEYKQLEVAYASRKAMVNSGFGVIALPFFRLFNYQVGETITFLARDLLHFTKEKLEKRNIKIKYIDTDSLFIESKENFTSQLNTWAIEWGIEKYNNPKVEIEFEHEGYFSSIFIQAMCRYRGRLETDKGQKVETKGIQMKRRDSNVWVKTFQEQLYDRILDGHEKGVIIEWIYKQIAQMQKADIRQIAVPCKFNKPREEYKKKEIYFEALDNTQKQIPDFKKEIGERFWWIYLNDERRVIALDEKNYEHIKRNEIDWNLMIERNILNLLVPIFKGLNWEIELLDLSETYNIILGSSHRNTLLEGRSDFEEKKQYYSAREAKKRIKEKLDK